MKLRQIALAACAVLTAPVYAAIANGTTGNGELFLSVYDAGAKVSYTLDLGVRQNDFFAVAQSDAGYSRSWSVNDSAFMSFMQQSKQMKWSVVAQESTGGTAAGGVRLYTTVEKGQEAKLGDFTNQNFTNGTGVQMGNFFNAVNVTGTHGAAGAPLDFSVNGSSVNADPSNAYFGRAGATGPTLNGNAPFSSGNEVGTESFFYYLTRSGTTQLNKVAVDQFDNAAFKGTFVLTASVTPSARSVSDLVDTNGGYTLTYNLQPVPEPGTYALMLTGLTGLGFVARRRNRR